MVVLYQEFDAKSWRLLYSFVFYNTLAVNLKILPAYFSRCRSSVPLENKYILQPDAVERNAQSYLDIMIYPLANYPGLLGCPETKTQTLW